MEYTPCLKYLRVCVFVCQMLDRCSLITFAAYLSHKEEAWLFLEVPRGLPDKEKAGEQASERAREHAQ